MIEIVEAIGGYLAGKEKEKGYKNIGLTSFLVGFTFLILILIWVWIDTSGDIFSMTNKSLEFLAVIILLSIGISIFTFIVFKIEQWKKNKKITDKSIEV
jgi:cytochrome c biogenesis protein CcdA